MIVKNNSIISVGYNGTPAGTDNCCERKDGMTTLPSVIHAEDNALRKLTRSSQSAEGADVFVTTAPCELCAERLIDAGVTRIYYGEVYRCAAVIEDLKERGIEMIHLPVQIIKIKNGDVTDGSS